MTSTEKTSTEARLREIMSKRILVLDGAMGTMIQRYGLTEEVIGAARKAGLRISPLLRPKANGNCSSRATMNCCH